MIILREEPDKSLDFMALFWAHNAAAALQLIISRTIGNRGEWLNKGGTLQHLIVALVPGKKRNGWGSACWNSRLDPKVSASRLPFLLITLFLWSLKFGGILLNKAVSFYV